LSSIIGWITFFDLELVYGLRQLCDWVEVSTIGVL